MADRQAMDLLSLLNEEEEAACEYLGKALKAMVEMFLKKRLIGFMCLQEQ